MSSLEAQFQNLGLDDDYIVRHENVDENQNQNPTPGERRPMFQIGDDTEDEENGNEEVHEVQDPVDSVDDTGADDEESDDEEPGEPSHTCLICSTVIPISNSLLHKRDCFYHDDNHTCPFCHRRRRDHLMEEHIAQCAPTYMQSRAEMNRTIFLYRCSPEVIELSLQRLRESIEEKYKTALHNKTDNPLAPCLHCKTTRQHAEGQCLHEMFGTEFQWRAQQLVDREVLPQYTNYLELTKKNILLQTEKDYYLRGGVSASGVREPLKDVLEREAKECDQTMERLMNEKKEDVAHIIKRHKRTLGNRTTWARDFYVINILYPSMGIHISS